MGCASGVTVCVTVTDVLVHSVILPLLQGLQLLEQNRLRVLLPSASSYVFPGQMRFLAGG